MTAEGLGPKTTLEMNDGNRRKLGLDPVINELLHVRERWATVTNEARRSWTRIGWRTALRSKSSARASLPSGLAYISSGICSAALLNGNAPLGESPDSFGGGRPR